ncbi:MAG: ABC transporter substrate-binding protein, partial [Planctomycetota bacterium]
EQLQTTLSLYDLKSAELSKLNPDLVITQSLCEVCAVSLNAVTAAVESMDQPAQVLNLNPESIQDVLDSVVSVGEVTERVDVARRVVEKLESRIATVRHRSSAIANRKRVLLLEWLDPPFSAGHWTPELIELAGGDGIVGEPGERSRELQWDEIVGLDPDVIVIVCCGFDVPRTMREIPVLERQAGWAELRCVQHNEVFVIDGSAYFNRPGPRLVDGLEILAAALYPELHPLPEGVPSATNLSQQRPAR